MPSASASLGPWRCTGFPSQRISPPSGAHRPETVLISEDLPAPLSPISAVTLPGGIDRSTSVKARTGPNVLVTFLSSSSATVPLCAPLAELPALGGGSEVLISWPSWAMCPSASADGHAAPLLTGDR